MDKKEPSKFVARCGEAFAAVLVGCVAVCLIALAVKFVMWVL